MNPTTIPGAEMTYREKQITDLLMSGRTLTEVASRLGLAKATVSEYIRSARVKSGARTTYQFWAQLGRQKE